MKKNINSVLKEALEKIKPSKQEIKEIEDILKNSLEKIKENIKSLKLKVEIFVGGSFAKKTVIRKNYYDVDVFLRFDKKHKEVSKLTEKILKGIGDISLIHGSRDYFRIKMSSSLFLEIVPVMKVKKPSESENITDLSYSHVKYINKKIKSQTILDEIKLAKAFCYANQCYGAESYIHGFSGYGLELLVYHYGGFLKFIKAITKSKDEKIVIDIEKHFKNKQMVLRDLNSAKLHSPIILIDPTYKQRNALAALSKETFEKFKKDCDNFLKNPSIKFFEIEKKDLDKIKKDAEKKKFNFILLEAKTNKQEGDIAGSKLFKFYNHFSDEIKKLFEIKNQGFNYNGQKSARYFFVLKNKKEILFNGPNIKDKKNILRFKKKHKKVFAKKGKIYAKEKIKLTPKRFIEIWKKKHTEKIREMSVEELKII